MEISCKNILLIGYNFAPEPTGIGKYSGEMMSWLAEKGANCTVITTYPYYPYWRVQEPYRRRRFMFITEKQKVGKGTLKIIRCPIYIPNNPSGIKRMILDASFLLSSSLITLLIALFGKKRDYSIAVAPSFMAGFPALFYKFFRRSKVLYHIQDLQIEAAEQLGLIRSNFLLKILYGFERIVLNKADGVSSISEAMIEKVRAKTNTPVYFFPNWTDTEFFHPLYNREELKRAFGIDKDKKVILYSGAIGNKQGLDVILDAAIALQPKPYQFIICGTGPYLQILKERALELKLRNLEFKPLQPLEKFNDFLNMADLHLVIQKADASDLLLPSKLTSILSVGGLSLITAQEDTSLYKLNEQFDLAIITKPENDEAFIRGIEMAFSDEVDRQQKKKNARLYAESYLNKENIMNNLSLTLKQL